MPSHSTTRIGGASSTTRGPPSVAKILAGAIEAAGYGSLPPTVEKTFTTRIAADLQRQKHHPIVNSAHLLEPTLVKKYTELLSRELNASVLMHGVTSALPQLVAGSSLSHPNHGSTSVVAASTPGLHKATVEKILQRHSRERSAWSHIIDEDAKSSAAVQQAARQTRDEQIRIQKHTLDIQIAEQHRKRGQEKDEEAAYLQSVLAKQETDRLIEQDQAAIKKLQQKERRTEAQRVSVELAASRKREAQSLKDNERRIALSFVEDDKRRREEDVQRKLKAEEQIRAFVTENEELLAQKRRAQTSLGGSGKLEKSEASGRFSALPTGAPPPKNEDLVEKANLLTQRKDAAAQAYLSEMRQMASKRHAQEQSWTAQFAVRSQREADAAAEKELRKKSQSAKYAQYLREQVAQQQQQASHQRELDHLAREQIEYSVQLAELEERELHERERDQKRRMLVVLKTQQDVQRAIRSSFDVTPKVY